MMFQPRIPFSSRSTPLPAGAADDPSGFVGDVDLAVFRLDGPHHFLQEALVDADHDDAVEFLQLFVIDDAVRDVKKPVIVVGETRSELRGPDMARIVRRNDPVDFAAV